VGEKEGEREKAKKEGERGMGERQWGEINRERENEREREGVSEREGGGEWERWLFCYVGWAAWV
jgi:hypothetical protein